MNASDQSSHLREKLRGKPWAGHKAALPQTPPTMLAAEELQLLNWLAAHHCTGEGLIVDGGCFLGGSTYALASGLAANPAAANRGAVIHTFDLFNTTTDSFDPSFAVHGLKPGEPFLARFRENLAQHLGRIEIHEGDLLGQTWGVEKIEILFLDCCKTTALHDHAVKIWFPRLIAARSVVIQQDFGWWHYSWGNIIMEAFKEHFVVLDDLPNASRVYLCVKEIPEEKAARLSYASLGGDERLRLMEDSLKTVTRGDFTSRMLVNYAQEANQLGRHELVQKILLSIFASPRADLVNPVVVKMFPDQFLGPGLLSFPEGLNDPRLSLISQTCSQDRIAIYSLVYATQPRRVLEIGRARGGSTLIIASALSHVPGSVFVSIDPNSHDEHSINPKLEESLKDRVNFIHGCSPAENARAFELAKGKFDFVFIDATHYYEAVLADIRGVAPYLAEDAVLLFHDAFYPGVDDAIAMALKTERGLTDCGMVATLAYHGSAAQTYRGKPEVYGGVRMLRYKVSRPGAGPREAFDESAGDPGASRKRTFFNKLKRSIRKRLGKPVE